MYTQHGQGGGGNSFSRGGGFFPNGRGAAGNPFSALGRSNACRDWANTGTCSRGQSCKFDHSGPQGGRGGGGFGGGMGAASNPFPTLGRSGPQGSSGSNVCRDYANKGYCPRGAKCKFDHPPREGGGDTDMAAGAPQPVNQVPQYAPQPANPFPQFSGIQQFGSGGGGVAIQQSSGGGDGGFQRSGGGILQQQGWAGGAIGGGGGGGSRFTDNEKAIRPLTEAERKAHSAAEFKLGEVPVEPPE